MRLWSSRLLEQELAAGRLPEWEKTKYLLFPLMMNALLGGPIWLITPNYGPTPPASHTLMMIVGGIIMTLVTYFGIKMGYRANKKIDGKHFIERITILSVPILIKFSVYTILALISISIILFPRWRRGIAAPLHIVLPFVYYYYFYLISISIQRYGNCLKNNTHSNHGLESAVHAPEAHP